jgi:hypothetical protein
VPPTSTRPGGRSDCAARAGGWCSFTLSFLCIAIIASAGHALFPEGSVGRPWQVRMKASRSTHSSSPVPAASALKPKQGTSTRRTRKSTREPKPRRLYPLVHGGRYRANCHSTVNDVFRVLSWTPGFKFGAIRRSPENPVNPCDYGVFCLLRSEMFLLYPAFLRIPVSWAKSCRIRRTEVGIGVRNAKTGPKPYLPAGWPGPFPAHTVAAEKTSFKKAIMHRGQPPKTIMLDGYAALHAARCGATSHP